LAGGKRGRFEIGLYDNLASFAYPHYFSN